MAPSGIDRGGAALPMWMARRLAAGVLTAGLAASPVAATVEYTILDLGEFGPPSASTQGTFGISGSRATAISARGVVTGVSSDRQARVRAFRLLPPSGPLDLRPVADTDVVFDFAWDVSNRNTVAGGALIADRMVAALWDSAGTLYDLGTLNGARSEAEALNDADWVVGASATDSLDPSEGMDRAFLWRPGFGLSNLGALSGGLGSRAHDLDAGGRIVGDADDAGGVTQAVLWDGGPATLLDPSAVDGSVARGMNERGTVVGSAVDAEGALRGFRWTPAGGLQFLPALADSGSSTAEAVNPCDVAVGFSAVPIDSPGFGRPHAVRWTSSGSIEDLNERVDPSSGWLLTHATDIGPTGRITGHGVAPDGGLRGFLLVPVAELPCDAPTPTLVAAFRAEVRAGVVELEVSLADEGSWDGFHVYRSRPAWPDQEERLTAEPVRLDGRSRYGFTDRGVTAGERYAYAIALVARSGAEMRAGSVEILMPARELAIGLSAPNPASGRVDFTVTLPRAGPASLTVVDAGGRRVRTLVDGELGGGEHRLAWDGRLDSGRPAPAALYFLVLETGDGRRIGRVALIR